MDTYSDLLPQLFQDIPLSDQRLVSKKHSLSGDVQDRLVRVVFRNELVTYPLESAEIERYIIVSEYLPIIVFQEYIPSRGGYEEYVVASPDVDVSFTINYPFSGAFWKTANKEDNTYYTLDEDSLYYALVELGMNVEIMSSARQNIEKITSVDIFSRVEIIKARPISQEIISAVSEDRFTNILWQYLIQDLEVRAERAIKGMFLGMQEMMLGELLANYLTLNLDLPIVSKETYEEIIRLMLDAVINSL